MFCVSIRIDVINFDAFNSDDLAADVSLQQQFVNVTHSAIAQIAESHNIDEDSFYVLYDDSSADTQYLDGELQRSVFINESLCTLGADDLQSLKLILQYESKEISNVLSDKLIAVYLNGEVSDGMEVRLYLANQLSYYVMIITRAKW